MTRYSKQREAILALLEGTKDHPTAETVYAGIRSQMPNISLGTVYRNLAVLAGNGRIAKIRSRDETLRFDANTRDHYHWQCRVCGKVQDLPMAVETSLNAAAERACDAKIERHDLCFIGVCKSCGADEIEHENVERHKTQEMWET
ncbi:MAG: transcriptional repressor [Clostridiales bacterium]|jgi:Fur family peroxide stress response transcriptional regulator|nr:transcriptional repressor [Clostridiales bacterium]